MCGLATRCFVHCKLRSIIGRFSVLRVWVKSAAFKIVNHSESHLESSIILDCPMIWFIIDIAGRVDLGRASNSILGAIANAIQLARDRRMESTSRNIACASSPITKPPKPLDSYFFLTSYLFTHHFHTVSQLYYGSLSPLSRKITASMSLTSSVYFWRVCNYS
jgi:hypothetical protein